MTALPSGCRSFRQKATQLGTLAQGHRHASTVDVALQVGPDRRPALISSYILCTINFPEANPDHVVMDIGRLVGDNFARLRRDRGLTQEQVEERSGISQQYLSDLERGKRNPTVGTLYQISVALGVSVADLVSDAKEAGR